MRWLIPPVLVTLCLIIMVTLEYSIPIEAIFAAKSISLISLPLIIIGLSFILITAYNFKKIQTNIHTFNEPDKLVTSGLFKLSRNPIYLGFLLILIGAAILLNAISTLIGPVIFFLTANFWYIPFEEKAAEEQFGQDYLVFKNKVRRWL
ncbi:isoprenylcysteine carboxylmethyltransferase family protein [Hyphomicrobiales bacterium 4NK60-0047b]|jgi:protein-S-isoprenylcysteine O-methyltransferase Ste14